MMIIQQLPPDVVDQIAAGEVVERPAHLVKELIENSLDAKATEIDVDFDLGGRFVKVRDNGCGISYDELSLALARHATSKISKSSDIWSLHSYGFRGEALATIGSVSRLELVSRPDSQPMAGAIQLEFGKKSQTVSQGGEKGTSITVSDLFGNVPARLKFLKSEAAESTQIKQVIKALALANPQVAFRVRQGGKLLFFWPHHQNPLERAQEVLEVPLLFQGEQQGHDLHAKVFVASPHLVEKTSRQIWIFVQGRWVVDRGLQTAVTEGFRSLLMKGEYPIAVVQVTGDPAHIDINIHPTKSAIKFQNPSQAFRLVQGATRTLLESAPWQTKSFVNPSAPVFHFPEEVPNFQHPPDTPSQFQNQDLHQLLIESPTPHRDEFQRTQFAMRSWDLKSQPAQPRAKTLTAPPSTLSPTSSVASPSPLLVDNPTPSYWQNLQILGQARLTYIVAQSDKGLFLIDQHAAHERILFERFLRAWQGQSLDIQQCLIPITLDFEPSEAEALQTQIPALQQGGVFLHMTTPTTYEVLAFPTLLREEAVATSLKKMAREVLENGASLAMENAREEFCATMACHSALRAGQALSLEQMSQLMVQMDEFPLSGFCPHGRPVSVEHPWPQIEREFGRLT